MKSLLHETLYDVEQLHRDLSSFMYAVKDKTCFTPDELKRVASITMDLVESTDLLSERLLMVFKRYESLINCAHLASVIFADENEGKIGESKVFVNDREPEEPEETEETEDSEVYRKVTFKW